MANKNEKMTTTPKDKKLEDLAVMYLTGMIRIGDPTPSKSKKYKSLENKYNRVLDQLAQATSGEGRARIKDLIGQRAMNIIRKEDPDYDTPTLKAKRESMPKPPKSKPNKYTREAARSLGDIKDELLRSGKYGSSDRKLPSLSEAALIGARFAKKKLQGALFGNNKGGLAKPKMMGGGMAYGKKHMYVAGGSVTENRKKK
tara:strand:+ start:2150 stop:2749 length:600 start_codon:yes stop_codon:yes gene_type:complete